MASIVAPSLEGSVEGIQSAAFEGLLQKIHRREAKVGIIGLGYVGLHERGECEGGGTAAAGLRPNITRPSPGCSSWHIRNRRSSSSWILALFFALILSGSSGFAEAPNSGPGEPASASV